MFVCGMHDGACNLSELKNIADLPQNMWFYAYTHAAQKNTNNTPREYKIILYTHHIWFTVEDDTFLT
jgi:hypothetical protein